MSRDHWCEARVLPLSIGDGELADTADTVVSVPEILVTGCKAVKSMLGFWARLRREYGRINTTVIGGTYERLCFDCLGPEVRRRLRRLRKKSASF